MIRSVAALLAGAVVIAGLAPGAAGEGSAAEPAAGRVERVLVLAVPHLTWTDLGSDDSPTLDALIDKGAVGNLAVRARRRRTTRGDGYATIGAGTRAGGPTGVDGLALAPGEEIEGGTAAAAFERRTRGTAGEAAGILSLPSLIGVNDRLLFGAEVGALGDALGRAGVRAAVIGNADSSRSSGDLGTYQRQAVAALAGGDGTLRYGRVDRGLLEPDPQAAYGHRLDPDAVMATFRDVWEGRSVVLVEASDLARAEDYAAVTSPGGRNRMIRTALRSTDELVGRLLREVEPGRDAVLVVAPATPKAASRLMVVALSAPGVRPGLLRAASTRRSGFVLIADVAPTILELMGVARPPSMEGRPMETGGRHGDASARRDFLVDAEDDAKFRDDLVGPVAGGFVALQVLLSALAVVVLRGQRRAAGRSAVEFAALALLGCLPFTYLAALIPFSDLGTAPYLAFVAGGGFAVAAVARRLGRGGDLVPVVALLGFNLAVIVASTVNGSVLSLSTVFGDSPLVAWRFSGIGNLTYSQLVTAAVMLAGFLAHALGGRRGVWVAIGLLGAVLVVDGLPAWGSDVGGVLASVPAFGLVGVSLLGWRFRPRLVLAGAAATTVAMAAFVGFDLSRPSSERSHLGRLFEQIDSRGLEAFTDVVHRKLDANLSVLTRSVWTLLVPAVLAFLAYLVYRSPSALGEIQRRVPELRVALAGILVAGVLGFALNDSGIAIPGMMLGVLNPVLVYLAARWT